MKSIILISSIVFIAFRLNAQDCIRKSLSNKQILKTSPYQESKQIKLGGYEIKLIDAGGQIDSTQLIETVTLSQLMVNELFDILANYNSKPEEVDIRTNCEFEPRNAVFFLDKGGKLLEYVEICFQCHQFRASINKKTLGLCFEKDQKLMAFFKKAGIKYGTY